MKYSYGEVVFAEDRPAHYLATLGNGMIVVSYTSFTFGVLKAVKVIDPNDIQKARKLSEVPA